VSTQAGQIEDVQGQWDLSFGMPAGNRQDFGSARSAALNNTLYNVPMSAVFRLKSMSRSFTTDYDLQVTTLQVPLGYNLETV
jgi:hypothetical protein